jgi:hypothetical protein
MIWAWLVLGAFVVGLIYGVLYDNRKSDGT